VAKKKRVEKESFWDFWRVRPKKRAVRVKKKGVLFYNPGEKEKKIFYLSNVLFLIFLVGAGWLYGPLFKVILRYKFEEKEAAVIIPPQIEEVDLARLLSLPTGEFALSIPKIGAKAKVVANVNAADKKEYMEALKEGVAHAAGTAYPGQGKTVYLFAHSTTLGINQVRYNAVFYLLDQMEEGDLVQVVKDNRLYEYEVFEKKVVGAKEVEYLSYEDEGEVLVLQTCWPIGTALKRLLVMARPR
jgi:LPXTG-site transpeptidase (sortase) family protein